MLKFLFSFLFAIISGLAIYSVSAWPDALPANCVAEVNRLEVQFHEKMVVSQTMHEIWVKFNVRDALDEVLGRSILFGSTAGLSLFIVLLIIFGVIGFFRDLAAFFPLKSKPQKA